MILDPKHIRIDGHVIGRDNVPNLVEVRYNSIKLCKNFRFNPDKDKII